MSETAAPEAVKMRESSADPGTALWLHREWSERSVYRHEVARQLHLMRGWCHALMISAPNLTSKDWIVLTPTVALKSRTLTTNEAGQACIYV